MDKETKRCSKCKKDLPTSSFTKRILRSGNSGLQPYCVVCNRKYQNERYHYNKEKWSGRRKIQNAKTVLSNKINSFKYLSSHPCVDCGEGDVFRLQFDHRGYKEGNVSQMVGDAFSWERIKKEIDKCDVRCANCHQVKTHKDRPWVAIVKENLGL